MLFASIYTYREGYGEEMGKRLLQVFANWKPPAGYEIKAHYELADGSGGIVLSEASTAAAAYEAAAAFTPFMHFRAAPVLDVAESVPIAARVSAWRDSVH
ncbi:MAG: DUF3303 family protein [Dehalococcoidia bacterium]